MGNVLLVPHHHSVTQPFTTALCCEPVPSHNLPLWILSQYTPPPPPQTRCRTNLMCLLWGCQLPGLERPLPVWACCVTVHWWVDRGVEGEIRRDGGPVWTDLWTQSEGPAVCTDRRPTGTALLFALDGLPAPARNTRLEASHMDNLIRGLAVKR